MATMAVEAKKLDVKLGDVVEIDGRRYDVVPDGAGDVTLEPAIPCSPRSCTSGVARAR
jgi:hypothetical protein